jgi:hypothetical protein
MPLYLFPDFFLSLLLLLFFNDPRTGQFIIFTGLLAILNKQQGKTKSARLSPWGISARVIL